MSDFVIWAKVEHAGPGQFLAIASAVPRNLRQGKPLIRTKCCATRDAAEAMRNELAKWLGSQLVERGDRVIDVEVE